MTKIEKALAECRAAFAAYEAEHGEPAKYAHGLHHEIDFEAITEPIENRIAYILDHKPKKEQAIRFRNLRPVTAAASAEYAKVAAAAWAEYNKVTAAAGAEYDKVVAAASAEYAKARAAASAEYDKVRAAASAEYDKVVAPAWAEYNKVKAPAHSLACPIPDTCTWRDGSFLR